MADPATLRQTGQLIKIETDRRLGHEWDEWDGEQLPNGGDFSAPARLYFIFSALGIVLAAAVLTGVVFLLAPRLALLAARLPVALYAAIATSTALGLAWLGVLATSYYFGWTLLPERLAERGPMLRTLYLAQHVGKLFGVREDLTGNATVQVYDRLALSRERRVSPGELLILIPRCLDRASLTGILDVASRYDVSAFVATRGQLARRVIRERRPRAVVAVACERDMVSGIRDVAGKVPVLGVTMRLPSGPCKDAVVEVARVEEFVARLVGRPQLRQTESA